MERGRENLYHKTLMTNRHRYFLNVSELKSPTGQGKKIKKTKRSLSFTVVTIIPIVRSFATGEVKCIDDEIPLRFLKGGNGAGWSYMCSMQAGKNISASEIYDKSQFFTIIDVSGNGLRGFTNTFNAEGHFAIIGRQGALCGCLK